MSANRDLNYNHYQILCPSTRPCSFLHLLKGVSRGEIFPTAAVSMKRPVERIRAQNEPANNPFLSARAEKALVVRPSGKRNMPGILGAENRSVSRSTHAARAACSIIQASRPSIHPPWGNHFPLVASRSGLPESGWKNRICIQPALRPTKITGLARVSKASAFLSLSSTWTPSRRRRRRSSLQGQETVRYARNIGE